MDKLINASDFINNINNKKEGAGMGFIIADNFIKQIKEQEEATKMYAVWKDKEVIGYINLTRDQKDILNNIKDIGIYIGFDNVTSPKQYKNEMSLTDAITIIDYDKCNKNNQTDAMSTYFKSMFSVDIKNEDGSYKDMYQILKEANQNMNQKYVFKNGSTIETINSSEEITRSKPHQ